MGYDSTLNNPPNPVQAHAGEIPGQTFFRNLSETMNGAHRFNNSHIFSQGFSDLNTSTFSSVYVQGTNQSVANILQVRAPRISYAHSQIRFIFRARHAQSGSSSGQLLIKVYNGGTSGSLIIDDQITLSNSSTSQVHDVLPTASNPSFQTFEDYVTIQIGLSCTAGTSYLFDIAAAWEPLGTITHGTFSPEGYIYAMGTGVATADNPLSSAFGFCWEDTLNTLKKRKRVYASVSAISNATSTGQNFIMPFIRPHIVMVENSNQDLTLYYEIRYQNTSSSTKTLRVQALDVQTLFEFGGDMNNFSASSERSEGKSHSVSGSSTGTVTGDITLKPPFQTLRGVPDGHFIAFAVGTRAMAPRGPMRYTDGTLFDESLKISGYSFWGE